MNTLLLILNIVWTLLLILATAVLQHLYHGIQAGEAQKREREKRPRREMGTI